MFLNWCKDFGNCPHLIETRSCLSSIFYQNNVACWRTTFYVLLVSILYSKTLGQLVRTTLLLGETIFWGDILLKGRQSPWASTLAEPVRKVFQFLPELPRKILSWVNPFECLIKHPGKSICVRRQKSSPAGLPCQLAGKIFFSDNQQGGIETLLELFQWEYCPGTFSLLLLSCCLKILCHLD